MTVPRTVCLVALACALMTLIGCGGSEDTVLFQNISERASWSSANLLAFSSFGANGQRYIYRSTHLGGAQFILTRADGDTDLNDEGGWQPSHSPNGDTVVFSARRTGSTSLYSINARDGDRTGQTTLTDAGTTGKDIQPNWKPDGTKIIFATDKVIGGLGSGGLDIATINADGSGLEYVVSTTAQEQWPTFSPDGTKIAYQVGPDSGPTDIIVRDLGTGAETNITTELRTGDGSLVRFEVPAWGTISGTEWIYLHSNRDGDFDIFRIHPDGTGFEQITTDQRSDGYPVISPDGTRILFTRDRELWARDPGPGTGNERRITRRY